MSLIKNIGIGKEVLNPFTYIGKGTIEEMYDMLEKAHLVPTEEMIGEKCRSRVWNNFGPENAHYTITIIIKRDGCEYNINVYFNIIYKRVFIRNTISGKKYLEYLHEMYPESVFTYSTNYTYLNYDPNLKYKKSLL